MEENWLSKLWLRQTLSSGTSTNGPRSSVKALVWGALCLLLLGLWTYSSVQFGRRQGRMEEALRPLLERAYSLGTLEGYKNGVIDATERSNTNAAP